MVSARPDGLDELEIPGVDVQPGVRTTVFVGVSPNDRPFRPMAIEIPRDVAPFFTVHGFRVGGAECFADPGHAMPGELFMVDPAMPPVFLSLGVCRPGQTIEVDVFNRTDEVQRFACKFPGRWIDPSSLASSAEVRAALERRFPKGRR